LDASRTTAKGFVHQVVEGLPGGQPGLELVGLAAQLRLSEGGVFGLQRVDLRDPPHELLDLAVIGGAEEGFGEAEHALGIPVIRSVAAADRPSRKAFRPQGNPPVQARGRLKQRTLRCQREDGAGHSDAPFLIRGQLTHFRRSFRPRPGLGGNA